ncbi:MAG: hybrid sensor histidine kinase/response regulator [Sandaracinaceae bacterium]|jgi:two-component system sensor histidine kinase/response regulator|nr:hybrid sensor histidine kinase/response regulator [Sandaracinaceae bacterium]
MNFDRRAYAILYVDDEPANLVTMKYVLDDQYTLITTDSPQEALEIIRNQEISILLADQRMPGITGAQLCAQAFQIRPEVLRMIVTAYADLYTALEAINRGHVSRYLSKPWKDAELIQVLDSSLELVAMQQATRELEMKLLLRAPQNATLAVSAEFTHELANPLQGLAINVKLMGDLITALSKARANPERIDELIGHAIETHADAAAAINQLRGILERARKPQPREHSDGAIVGLATVVETAARIVRVDLQRVARFAVDIEAKPLVSFDPTALGQIVMNLLLNAMQAMGGGPSESQHVTVRVLVEKNDAVLTVSDSGAGMSEETRLRIFDPFFTTKSTGTGLGLAVVKNLIQKAGGSIAVTTELGKGSTFTVRLPQVTE